MLHLRLYGSSGALAEVGEELETTGGARHLTLSQALRPGDALLTAEVRPESADAHGLRTHGGPGRQGGWCRGDRPLLVGGQAWVLDLGAALHRGGARVLVWADKEESRRAIERAGVELAAGDFIANATGKGAELEGVTKVFFLTSQHDFNALGAAVIGADRLAGCRVFQTLRSPPATKSPRSRGLSFRRGNSRRSG
jgi:hypothetical protein